MDLNGQEGVGGWASPSTGLATAKFLKTKGSIVSTTEMGSREEMKEPSGKWKGWTSPWNGGVTAVETFLKHDLIVVSPGVDLAIEPIQEAMKKGVRVISEIELAYRFIDVPLVAVTGTNGKTTTTLLIGEMLKEDGKRSAWGAMWESP